MELSYSYLICCCVALVAALPTKSTDEETLSAAGLYASNASQIIATNLLKSYIDIDGNQVHSPLGVASILAVLAEGAAGETYDEFNQVFGYPHERSALRTSFNRILGKYQNQEYAAAPSFQTWLYIYRNYTAREEYKQLVREHYFVEVREINRHDYDWSEPNTSVDAEPAPLNNSKDVIGFETLKRVNLDDDTATTAKDSYGEEVLDKAASKFDRFIDDKQYVEKPVILEEIKKEQQEQQQEPQQEKQQEQQQLQREDEKQEVAVAVENPKKEKDLEKPEKPVAEKLALTTSAQASDVVEIADLQKREENLETKEKNKREEDLNVEENETVMANEKVHKSYSNGDDADNVMIPIQEVLSSNEPEKVSLPLQKLENAVKEVSKDAGEIMLALESHISSVRRVLGARSLFRKDDITSALSANSITGRELNSKTKMLLFNGLYFRGNWAQPFTDDRHGDELFFMTAEDSMKAPMMHTTGKFHTADLEHLKAKALCLKYENKKYAMLIILPDEVEGLRSVIEKLQPTDFKYIKTNAKEKELHVSIPKFQVEETSRSESMLKNLGLRKIFSREFSDLSLLADDNDLHVDEIVQFVNLRLDEGGSSENSLSVTATQARTTDTDAENFAINRPFLYFVVDCEEDFVIVSGKISAPEFKEELPIAVEVEFQQA